MDPAMELDMKVLAYQKPMNAVIDRGDSPIQQFYEGCTVFVTGGSGFLGKQLIEKLFRSCKIKKMYLLLRMKKGKQIQDRLTAMLEDPVYEGLREKQPHFPEKIIAVDGDVSELKLGLSEKDWTTITQEVNIIFHMAATVRFDEPIKVATMINVRGTIEAVALARQCSKLKQFIHISTAYCHATEDKIGNEVREQFYPCPVPPDVILKMVETIDDQRLNSITPELTKGWPNTYTFTKAIAEEVLRTTAGDLPVCIVKPPIVAPCYYEPQPGWMDASTLMGTSGIFLGVGLGVLHVLYVDQKCKLATVPLDYVNNAIIGSGWDSAERRKSGDRDIPIYIVANEEALVRWDFYSLQMRTICKRLCTAYAVWYCYLIDTNSKALYTFLTWFLHYIPAYVLDAVFDIIGKRPQNIKSFVRVYKSVTKRAAGYSYFLTNDWKFRDHNIKAMISRMSSADKAIYNCNINTIDFQEYTLVWCMGIRKYILKDGLKDSLKSMERQKLFKLANAVFIVLYISVLWVIARTIFSGLSCVYNLFVL